MSDLYKYTEKIESIFSLLGENENDISASIGYVFSQSPSFLKLFLNHLNLHHKFIPDQVKVKLQQYESTKGFTDFEIEQEGVFSIIIEAKRGWTFPNKTQLDKYSSKPSFIKSFAKEKKLIVFTESTKEFTDAHFKIKASNGYKVEVVSWKELWRLANKASAAGSHYEKRILFELITYLEKIMTMQNIFSNEVYVVALRSEKESEWNISWIDIVERKRKYFHLVGGNGWPKEPPNYIAFRYHGKLQSIHHIEKYEVFTNPHSKIREIPKGKWKEHFLYHLSSPIKPVNEVRTGNIFRNGRVKVMLDLLLSSKTIAEARDKSKLRKEAVAL